jgi:hypothetical protein
MMDARAYAALEVGPRLAVVVLCPMNEGRETRSGPKALKRRSCSNRSDGSLQRFTTQKPTGESLKRPISAIATAADERKERWRPKGTPLQKPGTKVSDDERQVSFAGSRGKKEVGRGRFRGRVAGECFEASCGEWFRWPGGALRPGREQPVAAAPIRSFRHFTIHFVCNSPLKNRPVNLGNNASPRLLRLLGRETGRDQQDGDVESPLTKAENEGTCDAGTALGEPEEMREPKVAGCVSSRPNRGGLVKGVWRQRGFWEGVPKRVMGVWKTSVGRAPLGVWGNASEDTRVRGIWRMRRRTDRRDRRKQGVNREKRG